MNSLDEERAARNVKALIDEGKCPECGSEVCPCPPCLRMQAEREIRAMSRKPARKGSRAQGGGQHVRSIRK